MSNLVRPDETGPAEAAYRALATHRPARPRGGLSRALEAAGQAAGHPRVPSCTRGEHRPGMAAPLVDGCRMVTTRPPSM